MGVAGHQKRESNEALSNNEYVQAEEVVLVLLKAARLDLGEPHALDLLHTAGAILIDLAA